MTLTVVCPNPGCNTTYPLAGMVDLGFLPDAGSPQGTTEATLSTDCPACRTSLAFRVTASWRIPSGNHHS